MVNKNSSGFAIYKYLSAFYFFADGYLFYLFFVVKNIFVSCSVYSRTFSDVCRVG